MTVARLRLLYVTTRKRQKDNVLPGRCIVPPFGSSFALNLERRCDVTLLKTPGSVCLPMLVVAAALTTPLHAQNGPPKVSVEVTNTDANPVPVVVKGGRVEQLVFFRDGYRVPDGKRLLIDDASVSCSAIGELPHGNNQTAADFERFGLSTSVLLEISYAPADCPEPVFEGPFGSECRTQGHVVGTAQTNGSTPSFQTSGGKPIADVAAGRAMHVFADARATLRASCYARSPLNFAPTLIGTGRLIDKP